MTARLRYGLSRASGRSLPWVVLAIGVALSAAAWFLTRSVVERDARSRFASAASAVAANAQTRIRSYSDLLYGLQGLFQADPALGRAAFGRYVHSLDLPLRYPGVRSVTYTRRVPAAARATFEQELRRDPELIRRGIRNVAIKPARERPEYFVLTYVEPLHAGETGLGFDLASDPKRMAAIAHARDTGSPLLSAPLVLATDPNRNDAGLVMRLALYRKDAFTPDVERRREAFAGLANLTFLAPELARHLLAGENRGYLSARIRDAGYLESGVKAAPQEVYSDAPLQAPVTGAAFEDTLYLDIGQRRWELKLSAPRERFLQATDRTLPWAALGAGLAISLLLSGLVRSLTGARQRAQMLADQITADLRASEARLAEEQRRTQELIEVLPNPIYFKSLDGRYLGVNKAWETYFGMPREAFLGKTVHELYPNAPEIARRLHADDQALWNHPGTKFYETTIITPDGKTHDAIYYKAAFAGADGATAGLIGTIVDITERKKAERRLALEHAVTRLLSEADRSGEIMAKLLQTIGAAFDCDCGAYWSADAEKQVMACADTWSVPSAEIEEFCATIRRHLHPLNAPGGLFMRVRQSGEPVWISDVTNDVQFRRAPLALKAGLRGALAFPIRSGEETVGVMEFFSRAGSPPDEPLLLSTRTIGRQIGLFIARTEAEERIRHLAHYDTLTGLANRSMFGQDLEHALARARRSARTLAILFIDLDRFKNINDTLGHDAGDAALKEIAQRLRACLRAGDTVGRLGGDEFVALLEEVPKPMHSAIIAKKILAAVARPIALEAREFELGASIGIAVYPADGEDAQSLLKNADSAMYRAKEQGGSNYRFHSAQMNIQILAPRGGIPLAPQASDRVDPNQSSGGKDPSAA